MKCTLLALLTFAAGCESGSGVLSLALPDVCGDVLTQTTLAADAPADVEGGLARSPASVTQRAVEVFAWRTFAAVHWPSDRGGAVPDRTRSLGDPSSMPLWRTWQRADTVFTKDSQGAAVAPSAWGTPLVMPNGCAGQNVDDVVWADDEPTVSDGHLPPSLTNRMGGVARFEVRMNRVAYDATVANRWWDGAAQQSAASVSFPVGATIVKAGWIEIDEAAASSFESSRMCVCDGDPKTSSSVCAVRTMGLVAFHMKTKTASSPQWIWSTFEHAANVEAVGGLPATFFDPGCTQCTTNVQVAPPQYNQITRVVSLPRDEPRCDVPADASSNVGAVNDAVQAATSTSFVSSYLLVGAQWPLPGSTPEAGPSSVFAAEPTVLGNTVLESYIQDTSSCMGCHASARTLRTDKAVRADFLFSLGGAGGGSPRTDVVPRPSCTDESEDPVCLGFKYARSTYELLPDSVGAKLHCSSCHLSQGRDRKAGWWAGSVARVAIPNDVGIAARINRCFTNSMNGKALCTTTADGEHCTTPSPVMDAFLAYIEWVTDRAKAAGIADFDDGFPALAALSGDAGRGQLIYAQKCAFCHGADGAGRYTNGYYRPALWGADSFNKAAGLFSYPTYFAAFIRANMPLGAGGVITDQEAWDLQSFLSAQPRPTKMP